MEFSLVPPRGRKMFYASNVDARYSFPTLTRMAKDQGAEIEKGDIVIFDNPNQNRRKALVNSAKGIMIIYAKLNRLNDTYTPLAEHDGLIRKRKYTLN